MHYGGTALTCIDSFTAHNTHLKANYVNQCAGLGGVSVTAAECRNLHQEPSTRRCLAAGAVGFLPPLCGVHRPRNFAGEPSISAPPQPWKLGGLTQNFSAAGGLVTYGNLAVVAPMLSGDPVSALGVQIFHRPETNKRRPHGSLAGGHKRLKANEPMAAANRSKNKPPVRLIVGEWGESVPDVGRVLMWCFRRRRLERLPAHSPE